MVKMIVISRIQSIRYTYNRISALPFIFTLSWNPSKLSTVQKVGQQTSGSPDERANRSFHTNLGFQKNVKVHILSSKP